MYVRECSRLCVSVYMCVYVFVREFMYLDTFYTDNEYMKSYINL